MRKVFVGKFIPRSERVRELGEKAKMFTNVYVKNLPEEVKDEKLQEMFGAYGKITSHKVAVGEDGKSKGFGFVAFEEASQAEEAVNALNNFEMNGCWQQHGSYAKCQHQPCCCVWHQVHTI